MMHPAIKPRVIAVWTLFSAPVCQGMTYCVRIAKVGHDPYREPTVVRLRRLNQMAGELNRFLTLPFTVP
jgi:hypothetical protein